MGYRMKAEKLIAQQDAELAKAREVIKKAEEMNADLCDDVTFKNKRIAELEARERSLLFEIDGLRNRLERYERP